MNERKVFDSVQSALRDFPWWPVENLETIRETLAGLQIVEIYTPPARSYIGLVPQDGGPIISVSSGYIAGLRDTNGHRYWKALPVNRIRDGGYTVSPEVERDSCPECFIQLPLSGLCDNCY